MRNIGVRDAPFWDPKLRKPFNNLLMRGIQTVTIVRGPTER